MSVDGGVLGRQCAGTTVSWDGAVLEVDNSVLGRQCPGKAASWDDGVLGHSVLGRRCLRTTVEF